MEKILKYKIFFQFLAGLILLLLGVVLGAFLTKKTMPSLPKANTQSIVSRAGGGKYTNPLLECDQAQGSFTELKPFKDAVNGQISNLEQDPDISTIAVYFRDMNNGPWFGINQNATFSPASLLKVPLAIAYYKLNEQNPGSLQKSITYKGPDSSWPNISQSIRPEQTLDVGKNYTMEDLIQHMLLYSDNDAYYLLFSNINYQDLTKVYQDFDLDLNAPGSADDSVVSVQGYSSFFRILFNASYLNQADSEKVLSLLAGSDYKDGLVAGVPAAVSVAHKFGERELETSNLDQLHDCGIIYQPSHPYLLCIMTQGLNTAKQAAAIKQVSSLVYSQVSSQAGGN